MTAEGRNGLFAGILFIVLLVPWLWIESQISINGDVAWMSMAAQHVLAGHRMTDFYYDTNPPMSYMLYTPVALLTKAGLPLWYAAFAYAVAVFIVSVTLAAAFLRHWQLDKPRFWGLLTCFAVFSLFPARYEFGQKDHLIALALFPFLLAQYAITFKHNVKPWVRRTAIIFGVPFILLKPHYGLLPVLLLVHRSISQKRLSVVFDFDFMALAVGVILYAVVSFLFFGDFFSEVLGASLAFYVSFVRADIIPMVGGFSLLAGCVLVFAFVADKYQPFRGEAIFLSLMSLAAIVPVLTQFKGFSIHMMPALTLLAAAAYLSLSLHMQTLSQLKSPVMVFFLFGAGYVLWPPNLSYPTHDDYRHTSLARYIDQNAAGSSFYMETTSTNVVYPLSAYTGIRHASRFPCPWFLNDIRGTAEKGRFAAYVAEDLKRDRPAFVALFAHDDSENGFLSILGDDLFFAQEWAHYRKKESITVDYAEYFRGTRYETPPPSAYPSTYDIYERIE